MKRAGLCATIRCRQGDGRCAEVEEARSHHLGAPGTCQGSGFRAQGFRLVFRVWGSGFPGWCSGFGVQGFRVGVQGLGFMVSGLVFRV